MEAVNNFGLLSKIHIKIIPQFSQLERIAELSKEMALHLNRLQCHNVEKTTIKFALVLALIQKIVSFLPFRIQLCGLL